MSEKVAVSSIVDIHEFIYYIIYIEIYQKKS